ncbi:TetR/AcrR family transcriptional regulator [Clostridium sp.]|uniref:TetR/AcrR family transcriptional regulator n=1 Tax=Clostridium sp. TaxID=1506 RepID=UPI003D6D27D6
MTDKISINQSQKILDAAFKCISKNGYANVSMRSIAEEANVVLSQVNYYYKNKEGLFIEVIRTLSKRYLVQFEECLKIGDTSKKRLSNLSDYFQNMLISTPEVFKLLYDLIGMSIWSKPFGDLLSNLFKDLSSLIERYVLADNIFTNKSLKNYSSSALSRMILGSILGTSIQIILDPQEENIAKSLNIVSELL